MIALSDYALAITKIISQALLCKEYTEDKKISCLNKSKC